MHGLEGAKAAIAGLLVAELQPALTDLQTSAGPLADGTLDAITGVLPLGVSPSPPPITEVMREQLPFLAVYGRDAGNVRRTDLDDPDVVGPAYDVDYTLQVLGWVAGDGWPQTEARRDRLQLAVRQVLWTRQGVTPWLRMVDRRWSEQTSPPGFDADLASQVSAFAVQCIWTCREPLPGPGSPVSGVSVSVGRADTAG